MFGSDFRIGFFKISDVGLLDFRMEKPRIFGFSDRIFGFFPRQFFLSKFFRKRNFCTKFIYQFPYFNSMGGYRVEKNSVSFREGSPKTPHKKACERDGSEGGISKWPGMAGPKGNPTGSRSSRTERGKGNEARERTGRETLD
jgi:hypothetical protein